MKRILLTIFLILLLPVWAGATQHYYVRTTAAGDEDGSSFANTWAIADINWSTINTYLSTEDVYVYFKRGDTFGQLTILGNGTYVPASTNRLYLTVDPVDSGNKPIFTSSGASDYYCIRWKNAGYITFDNLDLRHTASFYASSGLTGGDRDDGGSTDSLNNKGYIYVTNCDFDGFGHYALALFCSGDHIVVTDNTFTDCGNGIYFIDESGQGGSYHYIANNTGNNIYGYTRPDLPVLDGHLVGLQSVNSSIIENNTGVNCRIPIINWSSSSYYMRFNIFRNNTLKDSELTALDVYHGNNSGDTGSYGNLIYGNIIDDCANNSLRGAIRLNNLKPGSAGNRVFNNTIYDADDWGFNFRRSCDYTYWKNNIVWIDSRSGAENSMVLGQPEGYSMGSSHFFDYNLYWATDGDPSAYSIWINYSGSAHSWATWKSTAGHDTNSPNPANPLMTDPGNQDYTLQAGSPAIDAGGYLTNVAEATGTQTVITVSDIYWFHSDMGITDADGNAVEGMLITFYDTTNGLQNREITDINYGTSEITVASTDIIYDAENLTTPANTTQIALRFSSTRPDIGAEEYKKKGVIIIN